MKQIAQSGPALYYSQVTPNTTLPPGVYNLAQVRVGDSYVPAFVEINPDNDPPLDINPMIGGMVAEISDFFTIKDRYDRFGFAHKRGYLLHGAPGTGKTVALRLLQKKFVEQFDGVVLIWSAGGRVQTHYEQIRENEPDRPILVVCEDIDQTVSSFEVDILEFLDGQKALRNFVLVATTNFVESIPERIRNRPSRIDRLIEVGFPDRAAQAKYLEMLGLSTEEAEVILMAAATAKLSMAALKEVVIGVHCLGYDAKQVVERLNNPTTNASFSRRSLSESSDDGTDTYESCDY